MFEPGQGECDTGGDGGAKGKAPAQDGTVRTSAQRVYKCHCRPPVRTRPTQGQGDESALAPPSRGAGGAFPKPTRRSRDMGVPPRPRSRPIFPSTPKPKGRRGRGL